MFNATLSRKFAVVFVLFSLIVCAQTLAAPLVKLAAAEQEPYISSNLPSKGYVNEIVKEAFARVGYQTEIEFFPLFRAKTMVQRGSFDGMIPSYYDPEQTSYFHFSDPFPGNTLGLLKKKTLPINFYKKGRSLADSLYASKQYSFGLVRGITVNKEFDGASFLEKRLLVRDIQILDLLAVDRIDIAVIDKYTAADLLIHKRPHMLGKLEFIQPDIAEKPFHVAFSKSVENAQRLVSDFNLGLAELKKDGTLDRILDKHGLTARQKSNSGKKKIVIGALDTHETRVMQKLSREYEYLTADIEIEWRILDENTLRKRLLTDITISDGGFDVMMIGAYEAPIWGKNGWLRPIRNLPSWYDLEDVSKSARDGLSYQNELFALPFYVESTMTFYRKDVFEEAGVVMPDSPTYEEIFNLAAKVHNPDKNIYGIGLRGLPGWGQNISFISTLVNTFGGRWFDDLWRPTIDSKEWREALKFYKKILDKYGHPDRATNGWYENQELFAKGKLAIVVDATSFSGRLFNPKRSQVHNKTSYASAPTGRFPEGSQWLWSWSLAIPATTKFYNEAKDFVAWATSKEYIRKVAMTEGWVAVPQGSRLSTYGEEYRQAAPFADFVIQEIQKVNPKRFTEKPVPYGGPQFVAIPEFPAIGNQVGQKISQYLIGESTLEETLSYSQDLAEKILTDSGYYE